ncbi:FAD-dependent oxidoreductase [Candidatus Carsonella ruddii]|uniref:tRNA uridine 5-carboxymethylaminomethyl modification enzyme MnmG n=1 Tax=Carsonella ruddii TaxID=114186 RepID=A0AAE7G3Z6_CARRU|nr:FAD-dependent oxidoreductase [Candidatus Carsonella ruddii]AGS06492.1 tRNA uridine 5-carboxymethylaminomethyl modification enzyme GidA [Candidatus Carsonella ruddii DC]QLK13975.1 tRNA uridine-5-carboxymethylaminomethyl(34) synthesis enzyme MnmG [Candidatus Carsonella ruddii]
MIYNVIVIGSGHAGIEAVCVSSKICNKVKLITSNIESIGILSCNPSIGGIGKSHIVQELEILGGIMSESSDYSRIHSKILNFKKGESVHSLRYQIDRILYKNYILKLLFIKKNIIIEQNDIKSIVRFKKKILLIDIFNCINISKNIILCVGTFINSKICVGKNIFKFGRYNEKTFNLSISLKKIKLFINALKTGTPPRIDINYINYNKTSIQYSDYTKYFGKIFNYNNNIKCFITKTDTNIHKFIKKKFKNTSIYIGNISSLGPRYCPSIEDKIYKFPNTKNHQIFLEPEGYYSRELYLNGLSTSLSLENQKKLIKKITGLNYSSIIRFAYNIEYDYFDPRCLNQTLNIKFANNIFLSGQINGTTGYEEAAAQGFVAGINASRKSINLPLWKPKKWNSYIGVMINDLIFLGAQEPYRIFTARTKFKLFLRIDNSIFRLINLAFLIGSITKIKFKYYSNIIYNTYINLFNILGNNLKKNFFVYKNIIIMSKYYGYIKKYLFKF